MGPPAEDRGDDRCRLFVDAALANAITGAYSIRSLQRRRPTAEIDQSHVAESAQRRCSARNRPNGVAAGAAVAPRRWDQSNDENGEAGGASRGEIITSTRTGKSRTRKQRGLRIT